MCEGLKVGGGGRVSGNPILYTAGLTSQIFFRPDKKPIEGEVFKIDRRLKASFCIWVCYTNLQVLVPKEKKTMSQDITWQKVKIKLRKAYLVTGKETGYLKITHIHI
jgi:hypothetical protein